MKKGGLLLLAGAEKKGWSGMVIKSVAIEFVDGKCNYWVDALTEQ